MAEYRSYVTRRANQEPLAYILGTKAFMKHSFKVTPAVLVPRPETELLVESVAKAAVGAGAENLLDIGTGSGAIIVSLLDLLPQSKVRLSIFQLLHWLLLAKMPKISVSVKD